MSGVLSIVYKATQLITRAYYLANIRSRELEEVTGAEVSDGLELLNAILNRYGFLTRLDPYETEYNFDMVAGTKRYFIPGLAEPTTITFNLDTLRIPSTMISFKSFYGGYRAEDLKSLPFTCTVVRKKGGADLDFYFVPEQAYPVTIWGKFFPAEVTLDTDLSLSFESSYIDYFRYLLARKLCDEFSKQTPAGVEREIQRYEAQLMDVQPLDLTTQRVSAFPGKTTDLYTLASFGPWMPK